MTEGEDALLDLVSRIEAMGDEAKELARMVGRLVAVNRIHVANFDDYSESIRLGLVWGFMDAVTQLVEMHLNDLSPAFPLIFAGLRSGEEMVSSVVDFDAPELALELFAKKNTNFLLARNAALNKAWTNLPAAFDRNEDKPGLANTIFRHALFQLVDEGVAIQAPVAPNPYEILELTHRLMRD